MAEPVAIDAHQHFWRYNAAEYGWLGESMRDLRRDFLPPDLRTEMTAAGIAATVAVQARQTLEETDWLLRLARDFPFIRGVVGWAPLTGPDVASGIERLAADPLLKGLRHVLHDEPDNAYMLRPEFLAGLALLRPHALAFDLLVFPKHLPHAIELVRRFPDQVFVLDHLAKPAIRAGLLVPWRDHLAALAKHPNVYCKISGMVTEADWARWSRDDLKPYIDSALDAFGPHRLMFGSDWPVLRTASSYAQWVTTVRDAISGLNADEQARIFSGTAIEAYRLSISPDRS